MQSARVGWAAPERERMEPEARKGEIGKGCLAAETRSVEGDFSVGTSAVEGHFLGEACVPKQRPVGEADSSER